VNVVIYQSYDVNKKKLLMLNLDVKKSNIIYHMNSVPLSNL